jgi:hypothetical protein
MPALLNNKWILRSTAAAQFIAKALELVLDRDVGDMGDAQPLRQLLDLA